MIKHIWVLWVVSIPLINIIQTYACTGITLTAKDQSTILARTIEWGGSDLNSQYIIVPRGYSQRSYIPGIQMDGMHFTSHYGYVGLAVEQKEFIAEGINEVGLSAGLFYFPKYGQYESYRPDNKTTSIADLQLVAWILGKCRTIEEVKDAIKEVHIISIDPRASTLHWRFADVSGKQIVLEITNGIPHFYDNPLGVLTNSPGLEWQLINLNNYINLYPGTTEAKAIGQHKLSSLGAGSGFLGLPGDVTPPSRFVRAALYQTTAPQQENALKTVLQAFQILNNFDIPIGIEFNNGSTVPNIPSATQWTSATDINGRIIYYRTMYDSNIRSIDLKQIDFSTITYRAASLDNTKQQPITKIIIK